MPGGDGLKARPPRNPRVILPSYSALVENVIDFPLRRVCALGVPADVLSALRTQLSRVRVSTDAATLMRADLLVIGDAEPGAFDVISWVRRTAPDFPILFWSSDIRPSAAVDHCRVLLFDEGAAAVGEE